MLPLAIRFVATNLMVLCAAPVDWIVATKHALKGETKILAAFASMPVLESVRGYMILCAFEHG
jgi:hypothetical protein